MNSNLICFDWAVKRVLRQKSNFAVLEGLLSTLLNKDIRIVHILEIDDSQESAGDRFSRIDMLVKDGDGESVIVEVRNSRKSNNFHRMLYGVPIEIGGHISKIEGYGKVRRLYSVNIVYFDLEQSEDYVYCGRPVFTGTHNKDELKLSDRQREQFTCRHTGDLYVEYYVICINKFNKDAVSSLDEWISFLKTGGIPENAGAKGLAEARECLREDRLSKEEQAEYSAYMESLRKEKSEIPDKHSQASDITV
ncbi:MAG: Rpn family recombination-promoting nuclease/putative transposase [Prevotellaceae bacterium]|jgi:predicted transposase/invertase (TIGR01784 family)|nr:Rpn family recombination-promoting nuclease/putative transposase [Prevotellaceae bacterium]